MWSISSSPSPSNRRLDVLHLDGVVVMTSVDGRYLSDPAFEPPLAELDRVGVSTFVHPNRPADSEPDQRRRSAVPYPFTWSTTAARSPVSGGVATE